MKPRLKVGDRIRVVRDIWPHQKGERGTIVDLGYDVGVKFDYYNPARHDLGGHCEHGHGWWGWYEGFYELDHTPVSPLEAAINDYCRRELSL